VIVDGQTYQQNGNTLERSWHAKVGEESLNVNWKPGVILFPPSVTNCMELSEDETVWHRITSDQ